MLLGGQVAINPCRWLGRERSRHANPKPRRDLSPRRARSATSWESAAQSRCHFLRRRESTRRL